MKLSELDHLYNDIRDMMLKNPNPKRRYRTRKLKKIKKIVLHCDAWDKDLWETARYDVTPSEDHHISKKGCPGFTYHFFVEKKGEVFYCEGMNKITWHAGNHNGNSIGICIRYRATGNPNPPPEEQLDSTYRLLTHLCLQLGIDPDNIKGHRELKGTGYKIVKGVKKLRKTCPGMLVNMDKVRYIISMGVQKVLAKFDLYKGEIDGDFGPLSEAALIKYRKRG
jgi:N-acetyl-anhydromuramyl-L-alanine amidase AmpD